MPEVASPPAPGAVPAVALSPDTPQINTNPVLDESFSDLDQFSVTPDVADKPVDQQPPAPVRGKDGKFTPKAPDKSPDKSPDKPAEPVDKAPDKVSDKFPDKAPDKAPDKPGDKQPVSAPELRKAYETLKSEHSNLRKEIETLKTAKPAEDPEKKQMAEKLTAAEKRLAQLDETVRFTNYERSDEYKDKYLKPYTEAYVMGRKKFATLDIVEKAIEVEDPATGERTKKIIQAERPATEADFDSFVAIADDREARKVAKQLFGDDAAIAMQHREKVHELNAVRQGALDEYQKNGVERDKQRAEMTAKQRAELDAEWNRINTATAEKYPHLFKEIADDKQGNELLAKGYAFVDRAFGPDAQKMPPQELVKLHAQIRNRAAAFGRQVLVTKRQAAQLKELQEKIKALEESGPGAGDGDPNKKTGDELTGFGEAALDKYAHTA